MFTYYCKIAVSNKLVLDDFILTEIKTNIFIHIKDIDKYHSFGINSIFNTEYELYFETDYLNDYNLEKLQEAIDLGLSNFCKNYSITYLNRGPILKVKTNFSKYIINL